MKILTVFSGIGAPEAAGFGSKFGESIAYAEIDKQASKVMMRHYPNTPNLGDVTTVDWSKIQADILIGGSPCQAFSLAGNRQSLADDRGNLTLKFVEIFNAVRATFAIWENVPGVFNTADNAFGCLLGGLVGADKPLLPSLSSGRWGNSGMVIGRRGSAAWAVKNSKYFGVPQDRKRIFLVAYSFGNGARLFNKESGRELAGIPAAVLFEPEVERRNIEKGKVPGEGITGDVEESVNNIKCFKPSGFGDFSEGVTALTATMNKGVGSGGTNLLCFYSKGHGGDAKLIASTLRSGNFKNSHQNGGAPPAIAIKDTSNLLRGKHLGYQKDSAFTLDARGKMGVCSDYIVRKLTPIECLRLQGFPDNYLEGLRLSNSTKYRLIGNSIPVPVLVWLRGRFEIVLDSLAN
jgi:DNA (cytosine-5)-methyltransferase 1